MKRPKSMQYFNARDGLVNILRMSLIKATGTDITEAMEKPPFHRRPAHRSQEGRPPYEIRVAWPTRAMTRTLACAIEHSVSRCCP